MDPLDRIAELEAENVALRARVTELTEQLAMVLGKVAELEKLLGRNSSKSSKPLSTDPGTAKNARPENANRARVALWPASGASNPVPLARRWHRPPILMR